MKKFALLSVSDKTNIIEFAKTLVSCNYELLATGNTGKLLKTNNIPCIEISDYTGFPEVFDGRVKTLHPKIFSGILFRRDLNEDSSQMNEMDFDAIDIVCVNLYPFKKTSEKLNVTNEELIENIDIGGPSLIRAAAKNHKSVSVLTSPLQYESFISELKSNSISLGTRVKLAVEAFSHTAEYDTYIANTLEKRFEIESDKVRLNLTKIKSLRYGENPHQSASVYGDFFSYFSILHGKELSYNNILDLVAAVQIVEDINETVCAIIKHNNPCGVAVGNTVAEAYEKALKSDPISAFGGIVAFNKEVDEATAIKLNDIFLEVVVAPSFSEEAISILYKKKDRRILKQVKSILNNDNNFRTIPGGLLAQSGDNKIFDNELKTVTVKQASQSELEDLKFAWVISKHVKSNAIVLVKDLQTIGIGAGQVSRIDSVKISIAKAKEFGFDLSNSVAASDAFFPFADGINEFSKNGISAVIQPGGSVRDSEVIAAADEYGISMVFTGIRHFKH
ncbi:MAG TPA: bifunctional phosphoribosylaminoimidazolecarboxamide formyltransferase/IMP cyclohydrolase [Ignavibacteriaceae bacterium]|nr:bifunctional phosphoribosylaminoimidazolecarboxamide formyltransferase/IMP cyclohydrolase [Ignavibacteriaceae bacterium]